MNNVPANLKYTAKHEWIKVEENNVATVGITDFAQSELGDIVYVDIASVGEELSQEAVFGTVEAVKTVADLYLPVSGKVLEFNEDLGNAPEVVNTLPYTDGWMIKMEITNPSELDQLLSAEDYTKLIGK